MSKAEVKHLGKPDEVREFPKGRVELIKIGGATVGRAIFQPGWSWGTSVQPLAKTKSCDQGVPPDQLPIATTGKDKTIAMRPF